MGETHSREISLGTEARAISHPVGRVRVNPVHPRNGGHHERMPADPSPEERFVDLEHVAAVLAVAPDDVIALVHEGHLRGAEVGSPARWRIDQDSVDTYVDSRTEDTRRAALWRQSQAASFPELWGRGEVRHGD